MFLVGEGEDTIQFTTLTYLSFYLYRYLLTEQF